MEKPKRILLAGHEIGGQMQLLAETLRKRGHEAHAVAFNTDFRNYATDYRVLSSRWPWKRLAFALRAAGQYDVFHFFWGVSLFDFWRFTGLDLPILRAMNKTILVHFRGTDLVNIDYYHYLHARASGGNPPEPPRSRPDQQRKLRQWRTYADHLLVSTPDLLRIVPEAELVPQAIDPGQKQYQMSLVRGIPFRIAHAPTRRSTKGTDILIEVIEELRRDGFQIELDLIENESPDRVHYRFSQCDLGVDQLIHGWYGMVSVELMALDKPVMCYIDPELEKYANELPIIRVTPSDLKEKIIDLMSKPVFDRKYLGLDYVSKVHDVNLLVDKLLVMYRIV